MKNFIQVLKAVNSAMIGVGKKKNLEKDLAIIENTGPWAYIIAGLIMTIVFILLIVFAAQLVL